MKLYITRHEESLKSVNNRASWTLFLSACSPTIYEGVMALLWMMRSPEGHIRAVKDNSREVMK
jgi:hypothetical protein